MTLLLLASSGIASAQWTKVVPDAAVLSSFNAAAESDFGSKCIDDTYGGRYSYELAGDFPSDQAALMYIFGMQMSSNLGGAQKLGGVKVSYFNYNWENNFISMAYSSRIGDTKSYMNFQYRSDSGRPFFLIQNCVVRLPDPK